MPIGWFLPAIPIQHSSMPQVDNFEDSLRVEWSKKRIELNPHRIIFSGGVKATYELTTLTCDELTIEPDGDDPVGHAIGNVRVTDPDGTIQASRAFFKWKSGRAEFEDFMGNVHSLMLSTKKIVVQPRRWEFTDVMGTPCDEDRPLFGFRAPQMIIDPEKGGRLEKPSLLVRGRRVITLPHYSFRFDRKSAGMRLPTFDYSRERGLEVAWSSQYNLSPKTLLVGSVDSSVRRLSGYDAQISHNLGKSDFLLLPESFFAERFTTSYFDRVVEPDLNASWRYWSTPRFSGSIGAALSRSVPARLTTNRYTVPFEADLEFGQRFGSVAGAFQVRSQSIREESGPTKNRVIVSAFLAARPLQVSRSLKVTSELFGAGFIQRGDEFGWVSGQLGLVYQASPQVSFGAAFVKGFESGPAQFQVDRLYSKSAVHARSDLNLGPTKLSLLGKYDFDRKSWYDYQISLRQVAGCLEPFVVYRNFPSSLNFGVRLRLDSLFDAIARRTSGRP